MVAPMSDYYEISDSLSFLCAIFDWLVLGIYIGQRLSEFAQTTQKQPDYFKAPGRQRILKAFDGSDITNKKSSNDR